MYIPRSQILIANILNTSLKNTLDILHRSFVIVSCFWEFHQNADESTNKFKNLTRQ